MEILTLFALGGVCVGLVFLAWVLFGFIFLYSTMLFGAPYVPSGSEKMRIAKQFLRGKKRVLELGSGDGRVALALSENNDRVEGVEINPYLVWLARLRARRARYADRLTFRVGNFWKTDIRGYDAIYIYGISYIMGALEKKIRAEADAGAIIVAVGFPFPAWKPARHKGSVWVYKKK